MTLYLRVSNDSAILKGVLEFPATVVWTETPNSTYVLNVHGCKNDNMPCIVNVTRLYVIDSNENQTDGQVSWGWSLQLSIQHSNTALLYKKWLKSVIFLLTNQ